MSMAQVAFAAIPASVEIDTTVIVAIAFIVGIAFALFIQRVSQLEGQVKMLSDFMEVQYPNEWGVFRRMKKRRGTRHQG